MKNNFDDDCLETWMNPEPVCPHCNKVIDSSGFNGYDGEIEVVECYFCDKEFELEFHVNTNYSTRKLEGSNR